MQTSCLQGVLSASSVQGDFVLPMVLPSLLLTAVLTVCFHGNQDMNLSALRQQILSSNNTASEKADMFVWKSKVNNLSNDEWRELIAGIPEDVEKRIDVLKSEGTQLYWHICLIVHHVLL